jgi:hypothetical protein
VQKITFTDFSGGIQEATGPGDFTQRQWAQLKGIMPENETVFGSQWACQSIGEETGFRTVIPLSSPDGVYLVGIKNTDEEDAGMIYWCKAPLPTQSFTIANAITWTQLAFAENSGVDADSADADDQPQIAITPNPDFRFICYVPLEVFKYAVKPTEDNGNQFKYDEPTTDTASAVASGALLHSRRYKDGSAFESVENQMAVVVYVDSLAGGGDGEVKAVTFPNWRRMPQNPDTDDFYGVSEGGSLTTLFEGYPYTGTGTPNADVSFHPYTYKTLDGGLLPGRGVIPRANVGCMWNNLLVLGDVEWKSTEALTATNANFTLPDGTLSFTLNDDNTTPYRSYIYYSLGDIDEFDPRNVLHAGGADAAILGMHVVNDTLVAITAAGGPTDGIVAWKGYLTELISYDEDTPPNPFAVRRELIRGNLGGARRPETLDGHRSFSTLWSEAGIVVFVDSAGGVWYTDGNTADRLDRFGPIAPVTSTIQNHVASAGKHLFVWRNNRLLVFTLLTSTDGDGQASGCWTEIVAPGSVNNMHGIGDELYFMSGEKIYRYAKAAPAAERGCIDGVPVTQTISTATVGEMDEHKRKNWHRFGMTFEVIGSATVNTVTVKAGGALSTSVPTSYAQTLNRAYTTGYNDFVVPAGIGSHVLASATVTLTGNVRLQEAAFWFTGAEPKR